MATAGIFTATELVPLLAERGITLSASQVHRLVSGTPERVSLQTLAALCDILDVTPAQLIATRAENIAPRRAAATSSATGSGPDNPAVVDLAALRPRRAQLRRQQ
jgi:DNA-binding Xre family transcriptional regulator